MRRVAVMAYSKKARDLRRCQYHYEDGSQCKAYAMWDSSQRYCVAHERLGQPRKQWDRSSPRDYKTIVTCDCPAYNWPHRPGGGYCQWPDLPEYVCTIPAGESPWRSGASYRSLFGCGYKRRVFRLKTVHSERQTTVTVEKG